MILQPTLLLGLALTAHSLPQPLDWFISVAKQETLASIWSGGHHRPHPPPGSPGPLENRTVFEVISQDPNYSRLTKAIEFSEEIIPLLNGSAANITFFAVPNWALKAPSHSLDLSDSPMQSFDLSDAVHHLERSDYLLDDDDDDKDKERRRKFFKMVVTAILSYHVLPEVLPVSQLAEISTFPTNLSLSYALHDEPQRIRVQTSLLPPSMVINLYSKVTKPNMPAGNGVIHQVSHPLLPPLPVFSGAFMVPKYFSYFTSTIQHSRLADELDLRWKSGKGDDKGKLKGTAAVTAFLPANRAFENLPVKLQHFLFSPFGARVLKKLLQFHVVPDLVLHTDYVYNVTSGKVVILPPSDFSPSFSAEEDELNSLLLPSATSFFASPSAFSAEIISSTNITVPTLFTNHTIDVNIVKYNVTIPLPPVPGHEKPSQVVTRVWANGKRVAVPDMPAMNGAVHVVGHLIDPRGKHGGKKHHRHGKEVSEDEDGGDWEDWEEWLPAWAEEV